MRYNCARRFAALARVPWACQKKGEEKRLVRGLQARGREVSEGPREDVGGWDRAVS